MKDEDLARQTRDAIASSVWQTPPVHEEPVIRLPAEELPDPPVPEPPEIVRHGAPVEQECHPDLHHQFGPEAARAPCRPSVQKRPIW